MIENVTIVDKNGNGIIAEGLMYIEIKSANQKYVFYTLKEMVDNGRIKIYVAKTADTPGVATAFEAEEWANLSNTIVAIAKNQENPDIEHLKMSGKTFYIGDPKKIAVEMQKKQIFKDIQYSKTLNKLDETSVVGETQNTYFAAPEEEIIVNKVEEIIQPNAFDNTFKPVTTDVNIQENSAIGTTEMGNTQQNITSTNETQIIKTTDEVVPSYIETPKAISKGTPGELEIPIVGADKLGDEPVFGTVPTQVVQAIPSTPPTPVVQSVPVSTPTPNVTVDQMPTNLVTANDEIEKNAIDKIVDTLGDFIEKNNLTNKVVARLTNGKQNTIQETKVENPQVVIQQTPIQNEVQTTTIEQPVAENKDSKQDEINVISSIIQQPVSATVQSEETKVESVPEIIAMDNGTITKKVEDEAKNASTDVVQNIMAISATGQPVQIENQTKEMPNIIDTSAQNMMSTQVPNQVTTQIDPGASEIQFDIPQAPEAKTGWEIIQPKGLPPQPDTFEPPEIAVIPTVSGEGEVAYSHTAYNNNGGKAAIGQATNNQFTGPGVTMPTDAAQTQAVMQSMGANQLTLSPSTLDVAA